MSASRNNSKKPYCKVCHDAGKLEREYTNHYVKTYDVKVGVMKVTCPTLLSLECRYCGKNGHTVKFCQVLEETKKQDAQRIRERERREQQIQVQAQQVQAQAQRRPKNAFELLEEDEQEVQNEVKNEFPALGKSSSANSSSANSSVSWASRASTIPQPKPKPEPEPEPVQKPVAKKNVRPVLPNARGSNNWEYDIEDYGEYLYYNIAKYYPENAEKIVWMLADLDSSELDELATNPAALKQTADEANEILEADAIKALAMTRTLAENNDW